jgi:hypothetical protein
MTEYKFTFREMNLQRNFYVKDVSEFASTVQFWRYKIKDIDYYVPNYGHLLMFDSNYHDLTTKKEHKIIAEIFKDDFKIINQTIRSNALDCLSPDNFGQEFKNQGGVKLSDDMIKLLTTICTDIRNGDSFDMIIQNNLLKYVNNRVGTQLRKNEIEYVKKNDIRPFRKGEMVIYERTFDNYEVVLFIGNKDERNSICATKDKDSYVLNSISKDLLYHYADTEIIRQDTKPGEPSLSLDYIIETYNL